MEFLTSLYKKQLKEEEFDKKLSFIAKYVNTSRTIGGAFVWPAVSGSRESIYNLKRGVRYYIKDRVDLTLREIKMFYEELDKYKNISEKNEDIFNKIKTDLRNNGVIILSYADGEEIYNWLRHFEYFETYIEYFMLDAFVYKTAEGNYVPYDIMSMEPIKEVEDFTHSECVTKFRKISNSKDLENVLNNVKSMIEVRSRQMEGVINCYRRERNI